MFSFRTPVSLKKTERVISLKEAGTFDIKFNQSSVISTPARKLDFAFQTPPGTELLTVAEVIEKIHSFQKVNIPSCLYK